MHSGGPLSDFIDLLLGIVSPMHGLQCGTGRCLASYPASNVGGERADNKIEAIACTGHKCDE